MFRPGDIILRRRKEYKGPFKYLLTRIILFFTTAWWKGEKTSQHYHAEMVYCWSEEDGEWKSITMEPPRCKIRSMPKTRILVARLNNKPEDFDYEFFRYCQEKLGQGYDYLKFLWMGVYWLFLGWNWLGRIWDNPSRDICSEFVARFYQDRIGVRCSIEDANISSPDDIYDLVSSSDKFSIIYVA